MNTMIKAPPGWSAGQVLKCATIALTLALAGCGGGGGSSSSASVVSQIQTLVASGTAADFETAMKLLADNQDSLSAADFETAMQAISQA